MNRERFMARISEFSRDACKHLDIFLQNKLLPETERYNVVDFYCGVFSLKIFYYYVCSFFIEHKIEFDGLKNILEMPLDTSMDYDFTVMDEDNENAYESVFCSAGAEICSLLHIFGWEIISFQCIEDVDDWCERLGNDSGNEVSRKISRLMREIFEDEENYLELYLLKNRKVGIFHGFLENELKKMDHEAYENLKQLFNLLLEPASNPLVYYEDALHILEFDSSSKNYYSTFGIGYYSGYERSVEYFAVSPSILMFAYYLDCFIDLCDKEYGFLSNNIPVVA